MRDFLLDKIMGEVKSCSQKLYTKDGYLYSQNNETRKGLETLFSSFLGRKYTILNSSCTSGYLIAAIVMGLGRGDSVIVPSYGYPSGVLALKLLGINLIFCDMNPFTLGLNLVDLEYKVNPTVKCILYINMTGGIEQACELKLFAKKHKLLIIEDIARGFGGENHEIKLGTLGDISLISFSAGKLLSSGEGGALITDNEEYYYRAISLAFPGGNGVSQPSQYRAFRDTALGLKSRMTAFSMIMTAVKFKYIKQLLDNCRENVKILKEILFDWNDITLLGVDDHDSHGGWSCAYIYIEDKDLIQQFINDLNAVGISARLEYKSNFIMFSEVSTNYNEYFTGCSLIEPPLDNIDHVKHLQSRLVVIDSIFDYYNIIPNEKISSLISVISPSAPPRAKI